MVDESAESATHNEIAEKTVNASLSDPLIEPTAPPGAPQYLTEGLEKQDSEMLQELAEYALKRAIYQEVKAQQKMEKQRKEGKADRIKDTPEGWEDDEWEEKLRESGDDVPGKANRVTKTIDGRNYIYAQWREGDKVVSEYIAPVNPARDD